jgi:predicted lipoprotein with Yx(FWY)xxD motif
MPAPLTARGRAAWRLPAAAIALPVLLMTACNGSGASQSASVAETPTATAAASESMAASESASASESAAAMTEITVAETAAGTTLVGPDGMTLYIFTNDTEGVSNCSGDCATNWPPLVVADDDELAAGDGVTGELDTIERDDGSLQVTYDGAPLYYFAGDSAAGDSNGEGVGGVWFIASPDGAAAAATNAYDY